MHFVELYQKLHDTYKTFKTEPPSLETNIEGSALEKQEESINDLFLFLDSHRNFLFPELLVCQAMRVCEWYLDDILPGLGYEIEDQQAIADDYADLFTHLQTISQRAHHIEQQFIRVVTGLRKGSFHHEREVTETLMKVVHSHLDDNQDAGIRCLRTFRKKIRGKFTRKQIVTFVTHFFRAVEEGHTAVPEYLQTLSNIEELCHFVLHEHFQGKAVLVNTDRRGVIMPLWVTVDSGRTSQNVEFDNHTIDDMMRSSANTARTVASRYLRKVYDKEFKETAAVRCQFPMPWVGYRDTSASLLLAIQIVGDVLDLEPEPAIAVTGEVDASGTVLKIGWIAEKLAAANTDERITRMLVPEANLHDVDIHQFTHLSVIPVRSLPEALRHYYGDSFQQQLKRISRRQVLKTALGLVTAPLLFLSVKNPAATTFAAVPVAECDYRLLECARDLYQKKSDYQSAITILDSILSRFSGGTAGAEAQQLQAFALGQLGIIHLQQHQVRESLQVLEQAAKLWEGIHDHENQADIFFRIGEAYRYTVAMDDMSKNSAFGLRYYRQAYDLLQPSMELYARLQGKYYSLTGFMHYWIGEYEIAERFGRRALDTFEEPDSNWTYQTARQHLARTLVKTGRYDEAYDILQSTAAAAALQGPHDRARNTLALSELYLATGGLDKGLEFADTAQALCEQCNLHGQQWILRKMLAFYQVSR